MDIETLQADIRALQEQVRVLQQEKLDLEALLDMTAQHSDVVAEDLYSTVETTQRESAERFEMIVNTVPVPIVVSRASDDVIVYANTSAVALVDLPCDALLGLRMESFYETPEERQTMLAALNEHGFVNQWELLGHHHNSQITFCATVFIRPLDFNGIPCLLEVYYDLTEVKQAEAERARLQEQIINAQREVLRELSTPIIPVLERIVVVPVIGDVDAERAHELLRALLAGVSTYRAKVVILDVTGVPLMDASVMHYLNNAVQAVRLKGAHTIVTGISDGMAEAIVDLGLDWHNVETLSNLHSGLQAALGRMGQRIVG